MITKERLEELIKEGATIYRTYADVNVYEVKLSKTLYETDNAHLWKKLNNGFSVKRCGYSLDNLFETKEDAEFALRYQNITRTDTLSLPTWEEISMGGEYNDLFTTPNNRRILFLVSYDEHLNGNIFVDDTLYGGRNYYDKPLTKENYLKACEICRKLFLGQEV